MARPIPFSAPPSAAFIRALDIIGSKWAILALVCLADGPKRFNEVGRALTGISRRMLSITLRSLEQYGVVTRTRSEEHTSELQSLMRISYAVFCLKKKTYATNAQP